VVSYADPNVGHLGGVYRAASWVEHGQSDESRAYRSAEGKILARRSFHSGPSTLSKAEIEQLGYAELNLPGKHRFVRFLSRQARRKAAPAVVGHRYCGQPAALGGRQQPATVGGWEAASRTGLRQRRGADKAPLRASEDTASNEHL